MLLAAALPLWQQLSGINTVVFYSSEARGAVRCHEPVGVSTKCSTVFTSLTFPTAVQHPLDLRVGALAVACCVLYDA